jgi:hypothetical protein
LRAYLGLYAHRRHRKKIFEGDLLILLILLFFLETAAATMWL